MSPKKKDAESGIHHRDVLAAARRSDPPSLPYSHNGKLAEKETQKHMLHSLGFQSRNHWLQCAARSLLFVKQYFDFDVTADLRPRRNFGQEEAVQQCE
jgi:hypothetical protein